MQTAKMPAWIENDPDDESVLVGMDTEYGFIMSMEALYFAPELDDENETHVAVVCKRTTYMTPAHAIPILVVMLPPLCGHYAHGGISIETGLN